MTKRNDAEQQARGALNTPAYREARALLATAQTERMQQIINRDAQDLVPAPAVRAFMDESIGHFRRRAATVLRRFRRAFPAAVAEAEWLAAEHADTVATLTKARDAFPGNLQDR
jgi:hypothetical protein